VGRRTTKTLTCDPKKRRYKFKKVEKEKTVRFSKPESTGALIQVKTVYQKK